MANNTGMYGAIVQIIVNNRELAGKTQTQWAEKLNVSRRKYQRMEAGDVTLKELCEILELSKQILIVVSQEQIKGLQ